MYSDQVENYRLNEIRIYYTGEYRVYPDKCINFNYLYSDMEIRFLPISKMEKSIFHSTTIGETNLAT